MKKVAGSYRDPGGHVYVDGAKVFRTVLSPRADDFKQILSSGIIEASVKKGFLIPSRNVSTEQNCAEFEASYIVEHDKVPYISYPYEWGFDMLKSAALFHLEFQMFLMERDYTLSDATAYNIQFVGSKPVFIDLLSIIPYQEGALWVGYYQYLEQFLNPLLLTALKGIPFNDWYRGSLEGIPTSDLLATLSIKQKLNWRVLLFLSLYVKTDKKLLDSSDKEKIVKGSQKGVSKKSLMSILIQLHAWISKLSSPIKSSAWGEYAGNNTYEDAERDEKKLAIEKFSERNKIETLIDLGCNSGDYSEASIRGGAKTVIGFDFDHVALNLARARSLAKDLPYLPLWLNAANPSPSQGWRETERDSFGARFTADAVIALAFEHHLAIAKNIPLPDVVAWITSIAPIGIIEFVPKEDETVQQMLQSREDIFSEYSEENFEKILAKDCEIISKQKVSNSGRTLYEFKRSS